MKLTWKKRMGSWETGEDIYVGEIQMGFVIYGDGKWIGHVRLVDTGVQAATMEGCKWNVEWLVKDLFQRMGVK